MAARTVAAQSLDTSIDNMLTDFDTYDALSGQSGEPSNIPAEHFWATLVSKLLSRASMKPLILNNPRDIRAYSVAVLPANTVEARDPKA